MYGCIRARRRRPRTTTAAIVSCRGVGGGGGGSGVHYICRGRGSSSSSSSLLLLLPLTVFRTRRVMVVQLRVLVADQPVHVARQHGLHVVQHAVGRATAVQREQRVGHVLRGRAHVARFAAPLDQLQLAQHVSAQPRLVVRPGHRRQPRVQPVAFTFGPPRCSRGRRRRDRGHVAARDYDENDVNDSFTYGLLIIIMMDTHSASVSA